ncbi:MAG TPA: DUF116 domain-containing protein [Desulfobulbaceae bacterium]|nr:DUF116 domain-containing protein [Desulfobulbaceae bacterium]HHD62879.1 DUF116 domain-containing protein [Desulfobulbaceae bacterium]
MKELKLSTVDEFDREDLEVGKAKKRLFVGLVAGAGTVVILFLLLVLILPVIGLANVHPWAPYIFSMLVGTLILLVFWATSGLILNILFGRSLLLFSKMRGLSIKLFLPLMTLVGKLIGISKDRVRSSFVKVNNDLVGSQAKRYQPKELLLLMPHCLQRSKCKMRLTYSINNCKRCGKCPIDKLIGLSEHYGIHLAIATGGTIARRIVVQRRPKLILAVACERDLASGIQDTYPLPVFGILNFRPNGPCLDTDVPLDVLEDAIRRFMKPGFYPENKPVPLNKIRLVKGGENASKDQQTGTAGSS